MFKRNKTKTTRMLKKLSIELKDEFRWTTDCLSYEISRNKYLLSNSDDQRTTFKYTNSNGKEYLYDKRKDNERENDLYELDKTEDYNIFKGKYYTYYNRDKYDEGLHSYFTITIEKEITMEFILKIHESDSKKISLPREWLFGNKEMPAIPEVLSSLKYEGSYAQVEIGKVLYETLRQIFQLRNELDL